jgi:hypothetical protein
MSSPCKTDLELIDGRAFKGRSMRLLRLLSRSTGNPEVLKSIGPRMSKGFTGVELLRRITSGVGKSWCVR